MTVTILDVNAVLCVAAFAGLLWRLIGRWTLSYVLGRLVVSLLAAAELILSLEAARQSALGGPLNEAQYAILIHAIAVLTLVAFWPWLLERDPPHRKDSTS